MHTSTNTSRVILDSQARERGIPKGRSNTCQRIRWQTASGPGEHLFTITIKATLLGTLPVHRFLAGAKDRQACRCTAFGLPLGPKIGIAHSRLFALAKWLTRVAATRIGCHNSGNHCRPPCICRRKAQLPVSILKGSTLNEIGQIRPLNVHLPDVGGHLSYTNAVHMWILFSVMSLILRRLNLLLLVEVVLLKLEMRLDVLLLLMHWLLLQLLYMLLQRKQLSCLLLLSHATAALVALVALALAATWPTAAVDA